VAKLLNSSREEREEPSGSAPEKKQDFAGSRRVQVKGGKGFPSQIRGGDRSMHRQDSHMVLVLIKEGRRKVAFSLVKGEKGKKKKDKVPL